MIRIVFFLFSIQALFAKPFLVGIAGGTGSGKTTLAKKIQEALTDRSILVSQDAYYKDLSHLLPDERARQNFDHPKSLDFSLLQEHLITLREDRAIFQPTYSFVTHTRELKTVFTEPAEIVVIEGILLFAVPEIRDLFDLKIYVDTESDVRVLRRAERDIQERGRDFDGVKEQYLATVKPMHDLFVEPSKWHADIIIPRGGNNPVALELILARLSLIGK